MMNLSGNRYKIGLILSAIFMLGIGVSLYTIYSLPNKLNLSSGYEAEFTRVYFVIGSTFLLGALTVLFAMRYKKEIIVFRDRELETTVGKLDKDQVSKTTYSLDNVIRILSQANDEQDMLELAFHSICKQLDACQGAIYRVAEEGNKQIVELKSGYALSMEENVIKYEFGEGLIGQCAASGTTSYVDDIPKGYVKITSGLGSASPKYILIVPIKEQDRVIGVMELASFARINEDQSSFVEGAAKLIADKISIKA